MANPEVPIDVDAETGVWRSDGLPMLYVPRHFFVNNHRAVETALGVEPYRAVLAAACEESARYWCEQNAQHHGLAPAATFHHYLNRLSQRGWGRFTTELLDPARGTAKVRVEQSAFALEYGAGAGRRVCYMFEGFLSRAFRFLLLATGLSGEPVCSETSCAADRHPHCSFEVTCRNLS